MLEAEPLFEAPQGRRLYHSANYAGWKDWGGLVDFEILDQTRSMAKIKFVSDDGASKEYICVATFWDGTPLIKHEVTVKAKKAVASLILMAINRCTKSDLPSKEERSGIVKEIMAPSLIILFGLRMDFLHSMRRIHL